MEHFSSNAELSNSNEVRNIQNFNNPPKIYTRIVEIHPSDPVFHFTVTRSDGNPTNRRRARTRFNTNQIITLEQWYSNKKFANSQEKDYLAAQLKLDRRNIKVWFQNRRQKDKKIQQNNSEILALSRTQAESSVFPSLFTISSEENSVVLDLFRKPEDTLEAPDSFCRIGERNSQILTLCRRTQEEILEIPLTFSDTIEKNLETLTSRMKTLGESSSKLVQLSGFEVEEIFKKMNKEFTEADANSNIQASCSSTCYDLDTQNMVI